MKPAGRLAMRQTDDGTLEMRISSARRSDAGLYVCRILNEYGSRQAECRVEVRGERRRFGCSASPPRLLLESPGVFPGAGEMTLTITRGVSDVAARAGESVMLECHVAGPPDVDVDWLSNGKLIQPALLNCKMHFDGKRRDRPGRAEQKRPPLIGFCPEFSCHWNAGAACC